MSITKTELANGVRILVEPNDSVRSVAVGITCQAGSRHELDGEEGITHFIEHMLFKGTPTRNAKQIAEAIEGRGGVLNAFTDKEQTTYYARVLSDDLENAVDVLSDMMLNSLLDPEELNREKGVVLEEIKRGEDEPGDHVHELHIAGAWGQHPLGKPVIGTKETVSSFQQEDLRKYMARRYLGGHVLLSVAGYADPVAVKALGERLLGGIPAGSDKALASEPKLQPGRDEIAKEIEQVHFCIGGESVALYSDDLYTMAVLDGVLGSGMSSRLFQEVRERRGLAYAIGSYNLSYTSGGLFTIYGGTGADKWEQVQEIVLAELKKVVHEGLQEGELQRVKQQLSGNIVLSLEGMSARMMRMTKNELYHGRDIPVDETLAKVAAVQESRLRELAEQLLAPDRLRVTAIGPFAA